MLDGHSYRRDRIRIGRRRHCHIGDRHYRAFRSSPLLSSHNNHRRMARFALLPQKQRRSAATRQSAISWTASLFSCPLSGAKQKYPEAPKFRLLAHQENKPTQLKRPWVWREKTITFSAPTPPSFIMGLPRAAYVPSPWSRDHLTLAARRLTCIAVPGSVTELFAAAAAILRTATIGGPVIASLCKSVFMPGRIACG